MAQCVVWIEGVNFDETMFDTQKLSVVRGASRALEAMPIAAKKHFETGGFIPLPLITGASIGAFLLTGDLKKVEAALDAFKIYLASDPEIVKTSPEDGKTDPVSFAPFAHLQFRSACSEVIGGDTKSALNRVRAQVRLSQLKDLGPPFLLAGTNICEFDRHRAAMATKTEVPDGPKHLSSATAARWHYGRMQRQRLYKEAMGCIDILFTDDFQEMVALPPKLSGVDLPKSARNKIAVFEADGDKFGAELIPALIAGCGSYENAMRVLAHELDRRMKALLKRLVNGLLVMPAGVGSIINGDKTRLRFETILFGGDDVTFIVPAWLGWWLANEFFAETNGWEITDADANAVLDTSLSFDPIPIKFSAGLVFANTKTPIRSLRALSSELCRSAKSVGGLDIEILESIEPPHGGLAKHRERLSLAAAGKPIARADVKGTFDRLHAFWIKGEPFPASQAHKALQCAVGAHGGISSEAADKAVNKHFTNYVAKAGKDFKEKLEKAGLLFADAQPGQAADLFRTLQYRDYVIAHGVLS